MNVCLFLGTTKQLIHHWRGMETIFEGKLLLVEIKFSACFKQVNEMVFNRITTWDDINSYQGKARENFILVAKLFFIMGNILTHSQKLNKKIGPKGQIGLLVFYNQAVQEFLGWASLSRNGSPTHEASRSNSISISRVVVGSSTSSTSRTSCSSSSSASTICPEQVTAMHQAIDKASMTWKTIQVLKSQAGAGPTFPIRVLLDIFNLFSVDQPIVIYEHAVSYIWKVHYQLNHQPLSTLSIAHKGIFVFLVLGWRRGRRKGGRSTIRGRESTRELTKESTKEETRQLTMESTKGLTTEFAKESTRELTRQLTIEFAEGKAIYFSNRSLNTFWLNSCTGCLPKAELFKGLFTKQEMISQEKFHNWFYIAQISYFG